MSIETARQEIDKLERQLGLRGEVTLEKLDREIGKIQQQRRPNLFNDDAEPDFTSPEASRYFALIDLYRLTYAVAEWGSDSLRMSKNVSKKAGGR